MAITNVEQREIVEIPFTMPDGSILPHPALVISRNELQVDEDGMFYAVLISTKNYHPGSGDRYLNLANTNFTNLTNKNLLNNWVRGQVPEPFEFHESNE